MAKVFKKKVKKKERGEKNTNINPKYLEAAHAC